MATDLMDFLRAKGIENLAAHEVATEGDLVALLEASLGIAIIPDSVARSERLSRVPLNGLDLKRTVAAYCVAGRRRAAVCATFLNLLRSYDWPHLGPGWQVSGAA